MSLVPPFGIGLPPQVHRTGRYSGSGDAPAEEAPRTAEAIYTHIYQLESPECRVPSVVLSRAFEKTREYGFIDAGGMDSYHHEDGSTPVLENEGLLRTAQITGKESAVRAAAEKFILACHHNNLRCERTGVQQR